MRKSKNESRMSVIGKKKAEAMSNRTRLVHRRQTGAHELESGCKLHTGTAGGIKAEPTHHLTVRGGAFGRNLV